MALFKRKKKQYAIIDKENRVYMKAVDDRQWVLEMFKRKGYIVDRNSIKEGK
ncbi:hypothetical protein AWH56_022400 [Anaerobacillus isosaccharinicus]|uniref:Uncharacterized protein n=1 Tax=Anaerobacillus isosaccharinicus TaxID=1532552 RepID=A0A7S7RAZ7_9BACI|nr:hypothetical protein [Anaerobacillus isosaccharinicus]MBA5586346.1 hypothetical protein [Anaerobacillus isosaccharinicus]QOY35405.1 hypothetical protein AWH56_022400 [Anaerobacillus isosaccharinicus]